ncbi:MAG: type 4a pilus biogenesis protein PilO [Phycisphaerae bacterium]
MTGPLRILLTAVALAVVAGMAAAFILWPLLEQTAADREAIRARQAELVKVQRVVRRIRDLKKEIKRLEEALAFFEDRLPEKREIDVILREVWLIADSKSLSPRRIQTGRSENGSRYNTQPITMTLEGRFGQFYEFLLGLERLPRITKVRQMQITKSPTQEGVVEVDVLMDIYCEK